MPLIAGLGNIGAEYEGTRHNIGFHILYLFAEKHGFSFRTGKGAYFLATGLYKKTKTHLILPTTYMNKSGEAISHALSYYSIPPSELLVITDDINIPIGTLRIKPKGSAGGHNGLSDIIRQLGNDQFARMRFGVGNDYMKGHQARFVLSTFSKEEKPFVDESVSRSLQALEVYLEDGLDKAMTLFN